MTTEMIDAARDCNHRERLLDGRLWRACRLLELGRARDADADAAEHAGLARQLRHPVHLWWVEIYVCGRALIAGELAEAERLARRARTMGPPLEAQGLIVEGTFGTQLLVIAAEKEGAERRSDMDEMMRLARGFVQAVPGYRAWWVGLAIGEFATGASAQARATLQRFAQEGFAKLPEDPLRKPILVMLGKLAADLGEVGHARTLYQCLKPEAGTHVMLSLVAAHAGPVSHHLGVLAATMGDPQLAISHFETAIKESQEIGSPSWQAWAEYECGVHLSRHKRAVDSNRGADLVRSALAIARRLGLARLEKKARATLRELR